MKRICLLWLYLVYYLYLSETQLPWHMLLQFNDLLNDCHDSLKIVTVKALASDHLRNFEKVVARAGRLQE